MSWSLFYKLCSCQCPKGLFENKYLVLILVIAPVLVFDIITQDPYQHVL